MASETEERPLRRGDKAQWPLMRMMAKGEVFGWSTTCYVCLLKTTANPITVCMHCGMSFGKRAITLEEQIPSNRMLLPQKPWAARQAREGSCLPAVSTTSSQEFGIKSDLPLLQTPQT
ncbi:hypothetical protein NQZ68_027616 [Dissostichus eleginoides]|nr:hypothetical protein NQZ68_027616 [Dissostichus eleginoides]